jgi:hypothetical protein
VAKRGGQKENGGPSGEGDDELQIKKNPVAALNMVELAKGCDGAGDTGSIGAVKAITTHGARTKVHGETWVC